MRRLPDRHLRSMILLPSCYLGSVVVAPAFLQAPEVRRYLNGVEPAWTLLEFDSYRALHDEPSARNQAIRLEPNFTPTDLSGSAVTRNALLVLRRAADRGGLALTATGNLPAP